MTTQAVPEGKYVDVGGGLRVHYHEAGEGPVVLFLHGSGPGASGWSNFRRNYPYLAARGYRCLVPDTLGYGYSSKPDDRDYDLSMLVGVVARFLDALGVASCAVIGNSHGGAMSMLLALEHPTRVNKLVLMAPGGLEERETYMQMDGIRTMLKVFFGPDGITREGMRRVFGLQVVDASLIGDDVIEERYEIARLQPKRVLSTMHVPNLAPRLPEIACPVLGFWGIDDRFCPPSGATTIARSCKNARVVLQNSCGHWVMVEHEAMFNRLTHDFLEHG